MICVWGKRSYGAVNKVGDVVVKTTFGHLWYLPLFPMRSYYFVAGVVSAFELKRIDWRSVLCGYVRGWVPVFFISTLIGLLGAQETGGKVAAAVLLTASLAAFIGSYLLDKKYVDQDSAKVRALMERHFSVALDPYECANNLQGEINEKMQSLSVEPLDESWYKRALNDPFGQPAHIDLALLRARCDQHDEALQGVALRKLKGRA
jgi:hypothetical protein